MKIEKTKWVKTEIVKAMAYDTPVLGYNTFNTNCLRLWSALPSYDMSTSINKCNTDDDYITLVKTRQRAERITSILLYKDKNIPEMQEHIIKQQYFFCAATIKDIIRRFKKNSKQNI
jgi:starch phosphorylase